MADRTALFDIGISGLLVASCLSISLKAFSPFVFRLVIRGKLYNP